MQKIKTNILSLNNTKQKVEIEKVNIGPQKVIGGGAGGGDANLKYFFLNIWLMF